MTSTEIAVLLIKNGADVNAQLQVRKLGSALAAAAFPGDIPLLRFLVVVGPI